MNISTDFGYIENKIKEEALQIYQGGSRSHSWDHIERVYSLAVHIGGIEGADLRVVKLAAILHDIGREEETRNNGRICHAVRGAAMASEILRKNVRDEEFIARVAHCIATHRFRTENRPQTLEAKIIFDADKLDSIGAVGIGRSFLFAGEVGAKLHNHKKTDISKTESYSIEDTAYREFNVKLKDVHGRMLTAEGKRLADGRHRFMLDFFERLHQEIEGIK
ncbi:MAG: HD domain-containing protein [Pseudomonadota bacterium]